MALKDYVLKEKDYITQLRRYFHAHPEVSLQEYETCKKIEEELDALGIPHRRVGETGVYAWIDGKKSDQGKIIALRADIDALAMDDLKITEYRSQNDGFCHACGHDAHTATLLGAAKILKSKELLFSGQVRLFFQQAEEVGQGARLFVGEGLLNGCERVFGAHVASRLPKGKVALTKGPQCASCDYFKITITGKGAHVSTPHLGVDAAYIASQIVVNLQSIVARSTAPLETVVVGVGVIRAGTQYNILAENAEIEGTTRSFLPEVRRITNEKVVQIAKQTAQMYGATAEVTFLDYAAPLVNDEKSVEEVTAIAKEILEDRDIVGDYEKALGADDFADYLAVTKGMYAFIGTGCEEKPNTIVAHHHGLFDIDEEALLLSCNLYVDYALWVLEE
ncbi:amidohydrolase [Anaerotignum sp.]|uniref:amidohydrolase n=1 Tax=Anaerotignum sp. TaxID=2039241 RepID=UPI0028AD5DE3|nr:amidohydrolase [Anaerotignum sp.]